MVLVVPRIWGLSCLRLLSVFILVHYCSITAAQNPDQAVRAGAVVADSGLWAAHINPASALYSQRFEVALGYRNYFFIPELHAASASAVKQLGRAALFTNVGLANGYPSWTTQSCSIASALRVCKFLRLGLGLGYYRTLMTGVASENSIGATVGVLFTPRWPISLGATFENRTNSMNQSQIQVLRIGAQSSYFEHLKISSVYVVDNQLEKYASVSMSYSVHKKVVAIIGFSTNTRPLCYGMSFCFSKWSSIVAFEHHLQLGVQPTIGLMHSL